MSASSSEPSNHRDDHAIEIAAEALRSGSPEQQAEILRRIAAAESFRGITVLVVELAGSRDDDVRMWAAEALETSVRATAEELPDLIRLLRQADDSEIAYWSATLIGRLGPAAAAAAKALVDCLEHCDYLPAREQAVWALGRIGQAATIATAALEQAVTEGPPRLSRMASHVLRALTTKTSFEAQRNVAKTESSEAAA